MAAPSKTARTKREPRRRVVEEPVDTGPSIKLLVGIFLLGLVMIGAFFGLVISLTSAPNQVTVPSDLINLPRDRAVATLEKLGLKAEVVDEYSTRPLGTVIRTDPPGNTEIRMGKAVTLLVSKGPEPIKAPTVVDKDLATAKKLLAAAGLQVGEVKSEYSDVIDKGRVIAQNPAGESDVQKGASLTLTLSKGPAPDDVPAPVDVQPDENPDEGNPDDGGTDDGNKPAPTTDPSADLPPSKNEVAFPISKSATGPQNVRIVVINEDGTEVTAYEQEHKPGDQVSQTVTVYAHDGKGQIRVYLNDRVIYRQTGPPFK